MPNFTTLQLPLIPFYSKDLTDKSQGGMFSRRSLSMSRFESPATLESTREFAHEFAHEYAPPSRRGAFRGNFSRF